MPLTETVRLDIQGAEARIAALNADINRLSSTQTVDVDVDIDEQPFRNIDERLESIERNVADVNREFADIAVSARNSSIEFDQMAQALGISENEARQLAAEILDADRAARQIDDSARDIARQLGLAEDDAGRFASEMGRASREAGELDNRMGRASAAAGRLRGLILGAVAAFGVRGLVRGAGDAIESFNALNESVNAVEVVFGDASDTIFEFGENSARSALLSQASFQQLVVPIGALLRNFGFDAQQAGDAAVTLTQRAADLASVFNTDVAEALGAIQAALRGEGDPIERFGASVSAARVEAKALELGLAATKAELTDLDRVTARYNLILADTARVQGDVARTADDPANAARRVAEEFEEARATIGEGLIPAFQDLLAITPELIEDIENLGPAIGGIASAAVAAAPGVVAFIQQTLDLIDQLTAGLQLSAVRDELVDAFDDGTEAGNRFVDILQTLNSAPGDFNQFAVLFGDSTVEIEEGFQRVVDAYNDMKDAIAGGGVPPFEALADALADIAENSIITDTAFRQFAATAGIGGLDLVTFIERFLNSSRAINLTGAEVDRLRFQIALLKDELAFGGGQDPFAGIIPDLSEFDGVVDDGIVTLRELQDAAREAGVSIPEAFRLIGDAATDLFPAGTQFTVFAEAEVQVAEFRDRVNAIGADINPLEGAAERIKVSVDGIEDEINLTAQRITDNLTAAFEQETEFEANLARLANRGFDALADTLRELGPGANAAVVEFLNDAALASASEDVIDSSANQFARDYADALRDEFRGSIFTGLPAELARQLALDFQTDPGTGFDSLAEKQARQIRQSLTLNGPTELKGAGAELADETADGFADRVAELAPDIGYDAAIDIARALTTGDAANAATQAGIDWAGLFSRAVASNVSFDFDRPTSTFNPPPPAIPQSPGPLGPNAGTAAPAFSLVVNNPTVESLPSALAQGEQAAQTITSLLTGP